MARAEAVEFLEASTIWVVWVLGTIVPFTECRGFVSGRDESVSNRYFIKIESFVSLSNTDGASSRMISSSEEFRSCRRAYGAYVETVKQGSCFAELVQVRSVEIPVSLKSEVTPTLIIREHYNDVRASDLEVSFLGVSHDGGHEEHK